MDRTPGLDRAREQIAHLGVPCMSTNLAFNLWSRFLDSGVRLLRTAAGSAGLALVLLASAGSVRAENVLQDITFAPGSGGGMKR